MNTIDILHVEDNLSDAFLVKRILDKAKLVDGYRLVNDGEALLTYLNNDHNPIPQIILLDIKLPKLSGLQVLQRLKKSKDWQQIPVIMFSSSNQLQDIRRAYELGANSYLIKPENYRDLQSTITLIITYWIKNNKTVTNE